MEGIVFNIQKFCVNDGPGIRTTVFLKGCPLKCVWCHNPESQAMRPELMYDEKKCAGCLRCVAVCPTQRHQADQGRHRFEWSECMACGRCVELYCGALELFGKTMTAEAALEEVLRDRLFYETSGGGMTISGGEPLYQAEFSTELLRLARQAGIHTCMETCGFARPEIVAATAEYTDLYLFDWKETDPVRHRQYTGVDNDLIASNLRLLNRLGKKIVLRCPIIPGYNDDQTHFEGIAGLANQLDGIQHVEVEPYHAFGQSKYERLGRSYEPGEVSAPQSGDVDEWIEKLGRMTDKAVKRA